MIRNDTQKVLKWGGDDAFTHTLVVGPTRCGKTALVLKPIIYQVLEERARGRKVGLAVLEPKGDVIQSMKEICDTIGEEMVYINPEDPENTDSINVMQGDKHSVAEATVAVLKALFGKQEAFFQTVQELSARKITLLLKELYGDQVYITHVLDNLRDESQLKKNVQLLKQKGSDDELVDFFEHELLNGKDADKYRSLIIGLRAQLENITSNEYLRPIITRPSSINLDDHFEKGGILGVNTALGLTGKAGDAFGQFIAMHLQLATFRRKGTERTRIPHYLIIDEYSRYINPDVERFLSIAAEYRVALIAAIQSLGQIELESGMITATAMKQAILTNCRNKIIFGGLSGPDATEIALELGKDTVVKREKTFDGDVSKQLKERVYRENETDIDRYAYTTLMDGLPRFHYVHKLLMDGHPQEPGVAVGSFVPRDPMEIQEHFSKIRQEKVIGDHKERLKAELQQLKEDPAPIWNVQERFHQFRRKLSLEVAIKKCEEKQEQVDKILNDSPFNKTNESVAVPAPFIRENSVITSNEEKKESNVVSLGSIRYVRKERSQEERPQEVTLDNQAEGTLTNEEHDERKVHIDVQHDAEKEPVAVTTPMNNPTEQKKVIENPVFSVQEEQRTVMLLNEPTSVPHEERIVDEPQLNKKKEEASENVVEQKQQAPDEHIKPIKSVKQENEEKVVQDEYENQSEKQSDQVAPTQDFWNRLF